MYASSDFHSVVLASVGDFVSLLFLSYLLISILISILVSGSSWSFDRLFYWEEVTAEARENTGVSAQTLSVEINNQGKGTQPVI